MGGMKRKRPIEFIEAKEARAVAFTKRREGLFSKASELCHLSDNSQIAIIATPVTSKSNASFYTFGHSSVDSVVSAFLENQRPCKDLGLGLGWWDDESLAESEDPDELREAISSMSTMLNSLKQTLIVQSSSASLSVEDYIPKNFEGFNNGLLVNLDGCNQETKSEGQNTFSDSEVVDDGALVIHKDLYEDKIHLTDLDDSNINNNNVLTENFDEFSQELEQIIDFETKSEGVLMDLEMDNVSMVTTNQNTVSNSEIVDNGALVIHKDLYEDNIHLSDMDEDQTLAVSDSNINNNNVLTGNFDEFSQELEQIIDFETKSEGLLIDNVSTVPMNQNTFSDSETVEDGRALENIHRDLYDNNIHLTDLDEDIQKLAFSDNNNNDNVFTGNFDEFSQVIDLDPIVDFETNYESIMMNYEKQNLFRGLDEDNLHFSDVFQ